MIYKKSSNSNNGYAYGFADYDQFPVEEKPLTITAPYVSSLY